MWIMFSMIKMIQVMKKKVPNHDIYLCGLDEANDEVINRHHLNHDENIKEAQNHDNFLCGQDDVDLSDPRPEPWPHGIHCTVRWRSWLMAMIKIYHVYFMIIKIMGIWVAFRGDRGLKLFLLLVTLRPCSFFWWIWLLILLMNMIIDYGLFHPDKMIIDYIPDNCRRRGRRRQCKFFWPV